MIPVLLAVSLMVTGPPARPAPVAPQDRPPAQATGAPPEVRATDPRAEAYYQFLLGRHLDSAGDADGAVAAFMRALGLDPTSAEIYAELAGQYARRNLLVQAADAATAALKNDPDHVEAHRLLGMIRAEEAERDDEAAAVEPAAQASTLAAIDHLEQALKGAHLDVATGIRLALGRLYLQTRKDDQAAVVLRQALTDEPGLPQGVALLAQAYTRAGQTDAAIDLLKDAVVQDPSFYASLGEIYEKDQRWSDAAAAYDRAAAATPRDMSLRTRWALALLNTRERANISRARDVLLEVIQANPTSGWALYLLARAQRESNDLDGAEQTARRLLAFSPTSVSGAHTLAQILAQRRAFAEIIAALAPVVDKLPEGHDADRALLLTHLGFAYLETHRLPESVAAFERALALDPDDDSLPTYLGQALNAARQFDRALALVRPRRDARASDVRLARVEADALRGQGRIEDGAAVLRALVDGPATSAAAAQALGEYLASAHRYAEAAAALNRAMATYPDDLDVVFQYAAMLERQKLVADAERVFRAILAKNPAHAPALNYLGYMLTERGGRLHEALELITRAVAIEPHNGAFLDSLGWTYFKMGRVDEAEPHLRVAAGQLPRDSVVQDHWGDLLAKRGRFAEAVDAWKLSLAGDGESIDRAAIERKIHNALDKQQ